MEKNLCRSERSLAYSHGLKNPAPKDSNTGWIITGLFTRTVLNLFKSDGNKTMATRKGTKHNKCFSQRGLGGGGEGGRGLYCTFRCRAFILSVHTHFSRNLIEQHNMGHSGIIGNTSGIRVPSEIFRIVRNTKEKLKCIAFERV